MITFVRDYQTTTWLDHKTFRLYYRWDWWVRDRNC